jgi:hypothetical protein
VSSNGSGPDLNRIGGFLVSIDAMKPWQVDDVVLAQRKGDTRMFGEIAISLGYIDDTALRRYVESRDAASTTR